MSQPIASSGETSTIPIKFHFYSLKFTPRSEDKNVLRSNDILNKVITYIMSKKLEGQGHLIDRHQNRDLEEPRELFMSSAVIMAKEKRIRCSLALLRSGRQPMLKPADDFKLVPLKTLGTLTEQTHFYIDYSKSYAVVCIEFNSNGPRMPDIEYYLRSVAKTLKIARATEMSVFMDTSIDKTLAELKNVLNMEIKVQPQKLAQMDTDLVGQYFTGITNFGNKIKPRFVKLEALFQSPGKAVESSQLNKEAVSMVTNLLNRFKQNPQNIDCFENFTVKYEDKNGQEEVFNLLRGKKEIIKDVDLRKITKLSEWYALIEKDFDEFVESI